MAVAKVMKKDIENNLAIRRAWKWTNVWYISSNHP
jgi:hypothetical protein